MLTHDWTRSFRRTEAKVSDLDLAVAAALRRDSASATLCVSFPST
jgi:hypothetical protein